MSVVQSAAGDVDVDLRTLFASLARHWRRILAVALGVAAVALILAWLATPQYKSETKLVIEPRESVFTRPIGDSDTDRPMLDEEGITSQVQIIGSSDILRQVARDLKLASLPEFDEAVGLSTFGRLMVLTGLKSDPNEIPADERVLKAFREKLNIYRVEKSRVIVVEFSSEDPRLAADVPNAIAAAYLAGNRAAKLQSNADATEWLEPEIASLTKKVKDAEAKVAEYRSQSDLMIGPNNSALATQQLSELSTELSKIRASRGAAEANAQAVRAALAGGGSLEAFPDVLSSGLIQRLRERQVQLEADIADLSTTLLGNHPRIRALKSQLSDLERQIREAGRTVLQALGNESKAAQLRENQLVADLNTLKAESSRVGEKEVELRSLEREAVAQRQLLESYLTRYREAASRRDGNYLPADARVFSTALTPSEPYFPKILPIVSAAFVGSLLLMAVITLLQELFSGRAMRPAHGSRPDPVEQVYMPAYALGAEPDPQSAAAWRERAANTSHAVHETRFGEVGIQQAAEMLIAGGANRALFISPEGDEAAASAVLVAREVADSGLRVLLMDLTASGAASGPMLDGARVSGITNLLASEAQFADVIHADHYSDCHVIPVGTADPVKAMRAVDRLPIIMESLTTAYDVVIVECGPANVDSIRRLVSDGTEILVSVIEPVDEVIAAREDLAAGGYDSLTLVTPGDYDGSYAPQPDRISA